jgi:uncharacterized protein with FMN-binding domain/ferredoxin
MKQHRKKSVLQLSRLVIQILFFIFLPALYFQALTGIRQLYTAIIHQQFSMALWPQMTEAIVIIPVTLLVGRFFCGWMCAFGSFTDFVYQISQKIFHKKIKIGEPMDRRMKYLKYAVLLVLIIASWTLNTSVFSSSSPWDVFGMLATVGKAPDFSYVLSNLTIGLALFVLIVFASAFTERFFCRYLCPMGAIFSLVSKSKIVKITKPAGNCGNCRACTNACAMGIPLYRMDSVDSGECIDCMKCVSVCPRKNAGAAVSGKDVRPLAAGITAAAVVAGMYYTNLKLSQIGKSTFPSVSQSGQTASGGTGQSAGLVQSDGNTGESNSSVSSALPSGQYKDGTYHGSGTGFRGGTTTVTVIVSGGKITAVNVDSNEDSPNFFNSAYTTVSSEIISSQSTEVDAVSGATYSSKGIMAAVANALQTAKI